MINRLNICLVLLSVFLVFEASTTVHAQSELWHAASIELKGAIDVHVHGAPDSGPRSLDVLEMTRIARRNGMRALLFKNHHTHTASLAYLVNQTIPGIDVYGGIVLNRSVGGINPIAVEHMAVTTGGLGRVVWMPTWDSEHYSRTFKPNPQFVPISHNGQLLPDVIEVLTLMARLDLSLATGHSSPDESLLLIREAKALGVDRIIVTHPMAPAVGMTMEQQMEAARLGAFLEYCFNPLLPADTGKAKPDGGLPIEVMVNAIRAVGTEHAIISTDLGQELNPIPTDGMISFFLKLKANGFTQKEIEQMSKTNPAKFLDLQPLHDE